MSVGYLPDPFGQIAHLPALLRGFGVGRCVFWRGADESLTTSEFVWEAPDGSEVLVEHLAGGYGTGAPFPVEEEAFVDRIEAIRELLQPVQPALDAYSSPAEFIAARDVYKDEDNNNDSNFRLLRGIGFR